MNILFFMFGFFFVFVFGFCVAEDVKYSTLSRVCDNKGEKEELRRRSGRMDLVVGSTFLLAIFFFVLSSWKTENISLSKGQEAGLTEGYRNGQIDSLKGIIRYEAVEHWDGSITYEERQPSEPIYTQEELDEAVQRALDKADEQTGGDPTIRDVRAAGQDVEEFARGLGVLTENDGSFIDSPELAEYERLQREVEEMERERGIVHAED